MDISVYSVTLTAVVVGLVEVIKRLGLNDKWCPLLSVCLGIIAGVVYASTDIKQGILVGIAIGLSACGLYSGVKNTLEKRD